MRSESNSRPNSSDHGPGPAAPLPVAGPRRSRLRRPRRILAMAAGAAAVAALVLGLLVAPPDAVQGQAQRLMYVHVPAAWTGFMALALVAVSSVLVLLGGGRRWDTLARVGAELGVPMLGLAIAEGSIWGHSAWGVWWAWDPRLVTAAILWLTYVGYLALRWAGADRRRLALLGAVAFLEVPVVHFSVLWWRSLHQPPTLLRPSLSAPIASSMLLALMVALLAFALAGAWFVLARYEQLVPAEGREGSGPSSAVPTRTRRTAAGVIRSASVQPSTVRPVTVQPSVHRPVARELASRRKVRP